MSRSTNAILFYGYVWDEETSRPWTIGRRDDEGVEDDWETRYAAKHGCHPPAEPADLRQYETYLEKRREIARSSSCMVDTHCSSECPMPYVAVVASRTLARRGYPKEISSLAVDPSWDGELAIFCEKVGISVEGKRPAWWLVSDWP